MKLAIDLGGTNIRIAQVEDGRCLNKVSVPCLAQADSVTVLGQLFQLIERVMNERIEGIGIGVPSVVDPGKGIVYNVTNISSWKEVHLKTILEDKFKVRVAINNDSNCFTLGEKRFGAGQSYANMVGVTIGTGIGAGVIINHHLYGGEYVGAGEIGALPYLDSDYEHYCSSFFFKQYGTTGEVEAEKAKDGVEESLELWRRFGINIGNLIKVILFTYSPQSIVLGGGIVSAFSLFEETMRDVIKGFPYGVISDKVEVITSHLKDASLLGASALLEE